MHQRFLFCAHSGNVTHIPDCYCRPSVAHGNFKAFVLKTFLPRKYNRIFRIAVFLYHVQIYPFCSFRRKRQQALRIFYERDSLISDLFCPLSVGPASDGGKSFGARNQSSPLLFNVQTESRFGRKYASDCIVQSFDSEDPVSDPFKEETVVFIDILVEKDHIHTRRDRRRYCARSRHR